ncbi:glycosyltransferase family protein [Pontibacter flavimaris]|uniref:Glycosyltransferase involved in cell wall biosynthesis n=1 Tax=Pontibacter flavimaris TaxID=1797110 RepID=A0A1Q5PCF5_9BACT|nr:glycosyltransferase [Pontibacter flavimaris]OKL39874.1 hypothetical protein A3841_15980 [Pontibacter flavimaris]
MESRKRILVTGIGQSNFLKQLYSSIHHVTPNTYEFDIFGLNELSGKDEYGIEIFSKVYAVRKKVLFKDIKNLFDLKLFTLSIKFVRYGLSFRSVKNFAKKYIITKSLFEEYNFNDYDGVHIHFPTFDKLDIYWHIPAKMKCIVSFWGSDLMRSKGLFNYYIQDHITNRADLITTHGNEMKQQMLTKFGRQLENKILFTRFAPFDHLYSLMEEKLSHPKKDFGSFLTKYHIPVNKKIVVIGHNGSPGNNHLKIIEALKKLSIEIKDSSFFVLPFAYKPSKDDSYAAKCQEALVKAGLQGMLLKDFLSWDDLAIFKRITDIMIHMPVSDALSGAMTEALFSGSKVITGDWLPYSPFTKEGLIFESTDFDNLPEDFIKAYNALPEEEKVVLKNRAIIKNRFLSDYCAKTWLPVFN